MTAINRSVLLPYPAAKVYQLINDIEAYPRYMKGCRGAEILYADNEVIEARLDLAAMGLKHSITTRNRLQPPTTITMELVEGPFSQFAGSWRVDALSDEACKVTLDLSFTLSSKIVAAAAKAVFNPVADNMVDVIVRRAKELYG